jgi:hypothetical protein
LVVVVVVETVEVAAATEVDVEEEVPELPELDGVVARRTEEELFGCGVLLSELTALVVLFDGGHEEEVEVEVEEKSEEEEEEEEPAATTEVSIISFSSPLFKSRARCTTLKVPSPM